MHGETHKTRMESAPQKPQNRFLRSRTPFFLFIAAGVWCWYGGFIRGGTFKNGGGQTAIKDTPTLPPYHLTTLSPYHLTTLPPYHLTTLPPYHLTTFQAVQPGDFASEVLSVTQPAAKVLCTFTAIIVTTPFLLSPLRPCGRWCVSLKLPHTSALRRFAKTSTQGSYP